MHLQERYSTTSFQISVIALPRRPPTRREQHDFRCFQQAQADLALWRVALGTSTLTAFVNSMSDLFHEGVPDDYIVAVAKVMADAKCHTFQVLTKRAQRLHETPLRRTPASHLVGCQR